MRHFFLFLFFSFLSYSRSADVHHCIHSVRKVGKGNDNTIGDGSTPNSCFACDPTLSECPEGCRGLILDVFNYCNGICLPDGYFFDRSNNCIICSFFLKYSIQLILKFYLGKTLYGCWQDNVKTLRINAERCGCSSAANNFSFHAFVFILAFVLSTVFCL